MNVQAKSIRPFIGAKDYKESLQFYTLLGFGIKSLGPTMSVVQIDEGQFFYLQNAFVKDWVDNSMIFLEVDDLKPYWEAVKVLGLPEKFSRVRLSEIQYQDWGAEFFLHDPSGILWHIGNFKD